MLRHYGRLGSIPETGRLRDMAACCLAALIAVSSVGESFAMCDVIPGARKDFRGALGSIDRPFAIPGDNGQQITLTLKTEQCDGDSPGFFYNIYCLFLK